MTLAKKYAPSETEPILQQAWQDAGLYQFDPKSDRPVYSIDTPPPTVSGHLHLGHAYSYSHPDFMARFFRMQGYNVFYPMGFDDNGLPTERLVEKRQGIRAQKIGREAFIERCLQVSVEAEADYRALWQRMGLSIDWRHTYRTISEDAQRIAQRSFLDLYRQGLVYRQSSPAIWCPECQTSLAQADLDDLERDSEFVTLAFKRTDGSILPIATTRPELLPACVAVFVHPGDARYKALSGASVQVPLFGQRVPVLTDPAADPDKGTGAVMCCTFGDQADVTWWFTHHLPLIEAIDRNGRMTPACGVLEGLPLAAARKKVKELLADSGEIMGRQPTRQSIRVHERCDTPVEYVQAAQWFVRILERKDELLAAGEKVNWHPEGMHARFSNWVENLNWDWCISRQRYFGVAFPLWTCAACGEVMLAEEHDLPINPLTQAPQRACPCGSTDFIPETDMMDTWATSSLSPQICGGWLTDPDLYAKVFPFSLRPQAHDIIRTWAFYTITKSLYHFNQVPWSDVLISGWGLAGEGSGKISKSRGGGPMPPLAMIEKYSADALRYWAASTGTGKDALISEEKIQMGTRLVTKLWNVARFAERFISPPPSAVAPGALSPADRWILARLQQVIRRATAAMQSYEYAAAKNEVEAFFWKDLADNYLEMAKQRLYNPDHPQHAGAVFTLHGALLQVLKMLAPFLPFVTETIYLELFAAADGCPSIHHATWPEAKATVEDQAALSFGEVLVQVATAVRRYKSEQNLALGAEFSRLQLTAVSPAQGQALRAAAADLTSVTRALEIEILPVHAENGELQIEIVV